jgi:hypothetical protein
MQVINRATAPAKITAVNTEKIQSNDKAAAGKTIKTFRFEFSKSFIDELSRFSKVHQFDERRTYKEAWQKWKSNPEIDNIMSFEIRRLEKNGYSGDIEDKMFKSGRYYFRKKTLKVAEHTTTDDNSTSADKYGDDDKIDDGDEDDYDNNIINPTTTKLFKNTDDTTKTPQTQTQTLVVQSPKPAQQQRRPYITMSKTCIKLMDDHIVAFSTNPEFKPSTSYDNFYQEKMSSLQMMTEIEVIVGKYEKTMTNNAATIVPSLEDIMHEIMDKIKKTYKNRYYRFANKK